MASQPQQLDKTMTVPTATSCVKPSPVYSDG